MRLCLKILTVVVGVVLAGCSDTGTPVFSSAPSSATNVPPAGQGGYYKIGNPYQVAGVTYYPKEDYSYKEVGVSSWYGADFHNGITANGETYDMHSLTAAHRTLPLPSVVRVTNLQNGRSLVLRVNDRGPFVNNRIIDVSMRAAQLLGFKDQGTTQVEVEILPEESRQLKQEMLSGQGSAVASKYQNAAIEAMPPKPKNLAGSTTYSIKTNEPAGVFEALVSASSRVVENEAQYNAWDADREKTAAEKPYTPEKTVKAKKKAAEPVKKQTVETQKVSQPASAVPARNKPVAAGKKTASETKARVVPLSSFGEGFYVQVGAFSSEDNAQKMAQKVSSYGKVAVSSVDVRGKTLYRVRLGPTTAQHAVEMMDKVTASGISGARLVEEKGKAPVSTPLPERESRSVYASEDEF